MGLKFYLNKFAKVDGIEGYTLGTLKTLQGEYTKFIENCDGVDPDFPLFNFGGKGKSFKAGDKRLEAGKDEKDGGEE